MMDKKAIEAAGFDKGMKAGIKEGEAKGKREEKEKIAKELLKLGISLEKIEKATGLTQEEIKKIKKCGRQSVAHFLQLQHIKLNYFR